MNRVYTANPFRPYSMGSFGNASDMLLRQHMFPDQFSEDAGDRLETAYSDRIAGWDWAHSQDVLKRHVGGLQMGLETWFQSAAAAEVLAFCREMLKADASVKWTGFRVLGGVNVSNGYPYYVYEVFAKGARSRTKVYSGMTAPNVHDYRPAQPGRMSLDDMSIGERVEFHRKRMMMARLAGKA